MSTSDGIAEAPIDTLRAGVVAGISLAKEAIGEGGDQVKILLDFAQFYDLETFTKGNIKHSELRQNLIADVKDPYAINPEAHHIVPSGTSTGIKEFFATIARGMLDKSGIGLDDVRNGIFYINLIIVEVPCMKLDKWLSW